MAGLKVYAASNHPIVPTDVIVALGMASSSRQASVVLVTAESKAEAARLLAGAHVSYSRSEFGLADLGTPTTAALVAAGRLDTRKVLALSNYEGTRVVRLFGPSREPHLDGWVVGDHTRADSSLFVSAAEVTQAEVDALARIIGAPGRTSEALRVLAAGYRQVQR